MIILATAWTGPLDAAADVVLSESMSRTMMTFLTLRIFDAAIYAAQSAQAIPFIGVVISVAARIRSTGYEVWLHRTNTLRKAAWQLQRKRSAVVDALMRDEALREKLGCSSLIAENQLHAWIVDTSIELDQQWVDGFLMVSLESLQVILRDERDLLLPADQVPEELNDTMFPDGFSAERFVEIVVTGEVWKSLD